MPYLKHHAGTLTVGFIFLLLQNYGYLKVPQYLRIILDEISGQNRYDTIFAGILQVFLYTAVMGISLFLMRKLIIGVSRKIEYDLRKAIYNKLLSLDYLFYQKNETGDLMSRCTNDLNHVRTLLGPGVMYVPNALSRLFMFIPVLIGLSGSLMAILSVVLIILIILIIILLPMLRPLFKQIQEAMGSMNNRVWQVISGISTIKRYTAEEAEIKRFETLNEDYVKKQMAVVKLQGLLRPMFFFVFSLTELVILYFGGKQVVEGTMTMGELLQFNVMISYLTFPILSLGWIMSLMQQGISALARINYLLHQPEPKHEEKEKLSGFDTTIDIKNLTYSYPEHEGEILKSISMNLEPGQTIGITGRVGSGKSTLLNIITGLLTPEPGQVFVDGKDVVEIDPHTLYDRVAVVSQDPFLFSRSVAENIGLNSDAPDMETIKKAAEDAGLASDIAGFRGGYAQEVGERGITLSGGQKQRVAIARALAKCAPVLVLDDPLSNVDARTETQILENLNNLRCFKILIIVSHRVSVLKNADTIYVMDEGAISEQGTHMDLIKQNGLYAGLAQMQQMETEIDA
ncbi:MAG: ABC transporter ATP-binding protein [bacterium]|nr:ABC transporter ATP-binding protein [bacterium]